MKFSVAIALSLISFVGPGSPILAQSVSSGRFIPPTPPQRPALSQHSRGGAVLSSPESAGRSGNAASSTIAQSARLYSTIQFVPPSPPSGHGAPPGRPRGGASRGRCPDVAQPLTALVPSIDQSLSSSSAQPAAPAPAASSSLGPVHTVWGLTVAEHPSFWFYVPYQLTREVALEFVLLDDNDNTVYQTLLDTTANSSGIVNVTLPNSAKALESGKMYHWYFMVYCAGEDPVFTQGSIQRVEPPAALAQIGQLSPHEQAAAYAANGIWFDALNVLATLHREKPNDGAIAEDWAALLRSANLSDVAQEPFVQCCTPEGQ